MKKLLNNYNIIHINDYNKVSIDLRGLLIIVALIICSNIITYHLFIKSELTPVEKHYANRLYLLNKANKYVDDVDAFERKVRMVSENLGVAPEWLMSVMYSESKFDAKVTNHKGSGAVGLIQWMPATAKDLGTSSQELGRLSHIKQLDYVYKYLDRVRKKYGDYESITDLYLAILYPKALEGDYCYTLYAHPSKMYTQNSLLDENKDKRVTVKDIDSRMKRLFLPAYQVGNKNEIALSGW